MKWNKKFEYPASIRSSIEGKRHYEITGQKLPSVTTILSATQSPEKKAKLEQWKKRVGTQQADRIRDVSAMRGTAMHTYLEGYILGENHLDLTSIGQEAGKMADVVIQSGLKDLEEVWGSEVTLYYPGLYAGATDVVGIYDGKESIIDFKQTNKPKQREWIGDYFVQLAAYAMAHNHVYGTKIQNGVILMCSKDCFFQKFEVSDKEFKGYMHEFLRRVDEYYKIVPIVPTGEQGSGTKNEAKDE
jgi:genome maintenance exonuclease 1